MTVPPTRPIMQAASQSAEPADLAKPAEDPLVPREAPAAAADQEPEASDTAIIATPELAAPPMLPPAPVAPLPLLPVTVADPGGDRDLFAIIAESRTALARGVESMSDELASLARHTIDATADTAIKMLAVKTWSDAVAVNAKFARTSYDQWLDSTAKVSELGVRLAYESSKPFMSRLGRIWRSAEEGR